MLTAGGQLLQRAGPWILDDCEQPKCVQTYFYGGDEAAKWRMMNMKKNISAKDRNNYITVFKKLHTVLMEADNKYIKSFLGVKDYIETHLKDKVWDIKLSIHANDSHSVLKHKGRLNVPTVNEIAIVLPSSDIITKHHKRQVKSCFFLLVLFCHMYHMSDLAQHFSLSPVAFWWDVLLWITDKKRVVTSLNLF